MKQFAFIVLLIGLHQTAICQDVRIYHGEKSESVFLKQNDKLENSSKESIQIVRGVNGIVTIHILNPNPFFYNYEIKTEDVEIKDDYTDQFAELVKLINALPDLSVPATSLLKTRTIARGLLPAGQKGFDKYEELIDTLYKEITMVKDYIQTSDRPETVEEALKRITNASGLGFRGAIANIQKLSSKEGRFNSSTLEKTLADALEIAVTDNSFAAAFGIVGNQGKITSFIAYFKGLNKHLLSTVTQILKVTQQDRIIHFQVPVKENKKTIIKLVVTKINAGDNVVRELINEEVANILPLYVRKRFEIVPVVNLIFQSNRQKYSVENDVVKSTPDDDAKFNIGAMALMNFASFGEFKEYGVGIGIGYSIQPDGKASSFFAIPSLSYKNIFRLGFGFGYNLSPIGLKNGATVGAALPTAITNIEDIIDYKRKPAAVLTLTIAGIKF